MKKKEIFRYLSQILNKPYITKKQLEDVYLKIYNFVHVDHLDQIKEFHALREDEYIENQGRIIQFLEERKRGLWGSEGEDTLVFQKGNIEVFEASHFYLERMHSNEFTFYGKHNNQMIHYHGNAVIDKIEKAMTRVSNLSLTLAADYFKSIFGWKEKKICH